MKVTLTQEQINFIIHQTGISSKNEAIEYFAALMVEERIDPKKLGMYVSMMMNRLKVKK